MKQAEIILKALENLRILTGEKLTFDGKLYIGNGKQPLQVEIKNEVRAVPLKPPPRFKKAGAVLVAGYIAPLVKNKLKENGINYLDAAGNCFIRYKDIFVFIEGRKVTPVREKPDGKLWTAPGLKYLWAIMQDPGLLDQTYRVQAEQAAVALGRIGDFLHQLLKEGYIKAAGQGWLPERQKELEEKWTMLYPRILKPKLLMGTFRFVQNKVPEKLPKEMLWGGEPAAAHYKLNLTPEEYTIYTWLDREATMKKLQLLPDRDGKIIIYQGFWKHKFDGSGLVPPAILYADLAGTGDSRNMEAARRIAKL